MLAVGKRAFDQRAGNALLAADQLHHHIGVAVGQRQRIVVPAGDFETARAGFVARRHGGDLSARPARCDKVLAPRGQRFHYAAPDRAETGNGDAKRSRHFAGASFFFGCSVGALLVPDCRNFFTLRAAWRMRCSFSTSATRT